MASFKDIFPDAPSKTLIGIIGGDLPASIKALVNKKPPVETVEELFSKKNGHESEQEALSVRLHKRVKCRSVFMSDFHLGTSSSCAVNIHQFLNHVDTEYLYLMGDIVDCWSIGGLDFCKIHKRGAAQTEVLQKLLKMERKGVKIIYIPGNHDEWFRDRIDTGSPSHGLTILFEATHQTKDKRRILVMHGDSFDEIVRAHRWLAIFGTKLYEKLAVLSATIDKWRAYGGVNSILKIIGIQETWSLSQALRKPSYQIAYSESYERAALAYLFAKNVEILIWNESHPKEKPLPLYDEIMCGHTHIPMRKETNYKFLEKNPTNAPMRVTLSNTGCWVGEAHNNDGNDNKRTTPTCTAILEDKKGHLQHVQWNPEKGIVYLTPTEDGLFQEIDPQ